MGVKVAPRRPVAGGGSVNAVRTSGIVNLALALFGFGQRLPFPLHFGRWFGRFRSAFLGLGRLRLFDLRLREGREPRDGGVFGRFGPCASKRRILDRGYGRLFGFRRKGPFCSGVWVVELIGV